MTMIEMKVYMDCAGCENKIRKALQKIEGVDDVDVDLNMQKVTVMGWVLDQEKILKTVRKVGCMVELWSYPYNSEYHNFVHHYYGHDRQNHHRHYDRHHYDHNDVDRDGHISHDGVMMVNTYDAVPSSNIYTYNYKEHGYNDEDYGYYHEDVPYGTAIINEHASAMFSDDNAHACSIM